MGRRCCVAGALIGALVLTASGIATGAPRPDPQSTPSGVDADALYREGVDLLERGQLEAACAKLAESQRVDPGVGTLLALARCHERAGRVATAWRTYLEAEQQARAAKDNRGVVALKQAKALVGRLPRLVVDIAPPAAGAPPLEVLRDGVPLSEADVGAPVVVDPGRHVIEIRSAGAAPSRHTVEVAEGETRVFTAGQRAPTPGEAPLAPAPAEGPALGALGVGGLIVGGAGVAVLGVGAVFGFVAIGGNADSEDLCAPFDEGSSATTAGYGECLTARSDAAAAADVSTALLITGGVLAALGVSLLVVDVVGKDATGAARVELAPAGLGAVTRGRF